MSTTVRPAEGRRGVLTVGLGAVATTFMAGVERVRRGDALPIGSLTQMATIRLGKRTENRAPLIKDFVPLAGLDDLVFGAWDPIPDDGWTAAKKAVAAPAPAPPPAAAQPDPGAQGSLLGGATAPPGPAAPTERAPAADPGQDDGGALGGRM